MSTTIGIAIASDAVRAVAVRNGAVQWASQTDRMDESDLAADLALLLKDAPLSRLARVRVVAVVGPAGAQTKRLTGLPALDDAEALSRIVRESAGRFFLRNGIPIVTTGVRIDGNGAWVAAFERPVVDAIENVCAQRKLRLALIAPTLIVLPLSTARREISWYDGKLCASATYAADGRLMAASRSGDCGGVDEFPAPVAALATLGSGAWRFADAYGAAVASEHEPIAWRARSEGRKRGPLTCAGKVAAIGALLAGVGALALPAAGDALAARKFSAQAAQLAPRTRRAMVARGELAHMSRALAEISAFAAGRHSSVLLLQAIAHALPDAAALASIHVDTVAGTMVIVAPRIAAALAALDSVQVISALEIVGPVTKEIAGGKELERASVHFRLKHPSAGAK